MAPAASAPTPSAANQDRSSYEHRRQTHYNYNVSYGVRSSVSCYPNHTSSSSMRMPMVPPAAMASITSGPHAVYGQNQNQHQIDDTYIMNFASDGITVHHNINYDGGRQFPSNFQEIFVSGERTRNVAAAAEGAGAILGSDSNYIVLHRHRGSGLSENAISNHLKTRKCTHQDTSSSNICVVCQDDICLKENDEELIATLHCGHEFHEDCIKPWLKRKNICPLCRAEALPLPRLTRSSASSASSASASLASASDSSASSASASASASASSSSASCFCLNS